MSSKRTLEERLSSITEKERIAQEKVNPMKARRRALEKRQQDEIRRLRTRRLIQIGAVAESVLGREFRDGDIELFQNFLLKQERNGGFFSKAMNMPMIRSQQASDNSESEEPSSFRADDWQ